jgi:kojibiose phosphorylase
MMERKNRYYMDSITTIMPKNLLAGALELLEELRQAGIKIAIGSASKNARSVIEKLHLSDYVDAAGMWTIGLGSRDRFKTADVILPNLIDVRWSDLQMQLNASIRVDE